MGWSAMIDRPAELTITIENLEAYGVMAPFAGLYRLHEGQWQAEDAGLLRRAYDVRPSAAGDGHVLTLEYEITKAGSYGVLAKIPGERLYLPALFKG